jgi:hypothetical protein
MVLFQPLTERCHLSVIKDLNDRSGFPTLQHRHVITRLLRRRLIDCQVLNWSALSSGQPPLDLSLDDSRRPDPGDLHLLRDCFDRRDHESRDYDCLKQGGLLSAWNVQRDTGVANSVFQAVNPGGTGLNQGDMPKCIEVSSLSLSMILGRVLIVTFWITNPPQRLMNHFRRA